MLSHINMDAGRLLRAARLHSGLTQRELAERTQIPQPMISAIERGVQDPRHGTLRRLLLACGEDLDLVPVAGDGVDRTQFIATLKATPTERLRRAVAGAQAIERLRRSARRI
jgi:transcriptional regulator with XRE-family HTH domain